MKQCWKQLPTIPAGYYCQIWKTQEDSKDDNKVVGMEDQKKILLNPATEFSDFVNAEVTTKTMATTNIEQLLSASETWQWCRKWWQWQRSNWGTPISCVWWECLKLWSCQEILVLLQDWYQFQQTWTFQETPVLHSSHLTNKAKVTFHIHMHATHSVFTLFCNTYMLSLSRSADRRMYS